MSDCTVHHVEVCMEWSDGHSRQQQDEPPTFILSREVKAIENRI